jgi:hypothetical protein
MYDNLEGLGIPSTVVDKYLDGLHSERVSFTNSVYEVAGGEEQYGVIKEWAENGGVSQEEIDAMQNLSYGAVLGMYKGIKARYDLANGKPATRITGDTNGSSTGGYVNQADYLKDVADRRYGQNRVYTESVDKKFSASKF